MPPEFNSPEFFESGDAGKFSQVQPSVESQLNSPSDINQAHQFFAPKGETALPNLNINGAETAALTPGAESLAVTPGADGGTTASIVSGAEKALGSLVPGVEQALLPGAEQAAMAAAGAGEPISPLIQLIMKMPGFTGIMSSVFEFFGALFGGGNLFQLFDPLLWMQHAGSLANMIQQIPIAINLIPANGSMLQFMGPGMFQPGQMMMHMQGAGMEHLSSAVDPFDVAGPVDMKNPIFENPQEWKITSHTQDSMFKDFLNRDQLAINNEAPVYRPTMGGFSDGGTVQNAAQTGGSATTATQTPPTSSNHSAHTSHHNTHHSSNHHRGGHHLERPAAHHGVRPREIAIKSEPIQSTTDSSTTQTTDYSAPTTDSSNATAGGEYTIQKGDSLWDIARRQLGDGSRWGEIYKLNADVIGSNPDLIHPGTTLQMPGQDIASGLQEGGKYIVQPGDNLWDISKNHMGGGQNWGELYRANQAVIGSNPDLIFPGQELQIPGAEQQLAGVPDTMPGMETAPSAVQSQPLPGTQAVDPTPRGMQIAQGDTNMTAPAATPVDAASAGITPESANNGEIFNAPNGASFLRRQQ